MKLSNKVRWGLGYVATFVVSFVLGMVVAVTRPGGFFGELEKLKWDESVGTVYTDLPYADGDQNKFDLYVPADHSRQSYGLVLYIHAGGFTTGDKADDASLAHYFVSKGYVAATINYTLQAEEHPSNVYKISLEIKQGVAAIKEEAARRGYNLDAMIVAGGSAGGALAMIYGYRDYHESPIPVKAVMQMVGPAAFEPAGWFGGKDSDYHADEGAKAAAYFVSIMTGDYITPEMIRSGEYKENLKKISPYAHVTKDTVPTLIAYGTLDKLVPIALSKYLLDALEQNGVTYDYIEFPRSGHGLNRDPEQAELLFKKINEYLDRYLPID